MSTTQRSRRVEIEPRVERAIARLAGTVIAAAEATVRLREEGLPERIYFPKSALVDGVQLTKGSGARCPHKGDWHYYELATDGRAAGNAAWEYYAPLPNCKAIRDHVAFDLKQIEVEVNGEPYRPE